MKIIVGLGNPGDKYTNTRHNIGFIVVGELAAKYNIQGRNESKFNAIIGKGNIGNDEVLIVEPLTYMNLSGQSVSKIINWYKIGSEDVMVVYDDISIEFGRIRFRPSGSDAGHNGIKSIIECFGGNKNFPRLKVGIGPDPGGAARAGFVLSKFSSQEKEILDKIVPICIEGIEFYLKEGIDATRNKFNSVNVLKEDE